MLAGCPARKVVQPEPQQPTVTPQEMKQGAAGVKPEERITEQSSQK